LQALHVKVCASFVSTFNKALSTSTLFVVKSVALRVVVPVVLCFFEALLPSPLLLLWLLLPLSLAAAKFSAVLVVLPVAMSHAMELIGHGSFLSVADEAVRLTDIKRASKKNE
jgi:hypothetical protein